MGDRFRTVPGARYQIVRCADCRLLYLNPRPTDAELGQFYAVQGYDPFVSDRRGFSPGKLIYKSVRYFTVRKKVWRVRDGLPGTLRVLDVGCATGELLAIFRRRGDTACGVEPDAGAAEFARKQGLTVWNGDIRAVPADRGPFDLIVFWHVLEHVADLKATLGRVRELLTERGRLAIAVPNPRSLDAGWYGDQWVAWDTPRHLYHFEPDVMLTTLDGCGFRAEHMGAVAFDAMYHSLLSDSRTPVGFIRALARGTISFLSGSLGGKGSSELYFAYKD